MLAMIVRTTQRILKLRIYNIIVLPYKIKCKFKSNVTNFFITSRPLIFTMEAAAFFRDADNFGGLPNKNGKRNCQYCGKKIEKY